MNLGVVNGETPGHEATLVISMLYDELRRVARAHLSHERSDHTIQPTALVHEVYLRLANLPGAQEREQFLGLASRVMRQVLVDYARRRQSKKRADFTYRVTLGDDLATVSPNLELLALDEALEELDRMDPRQARIVEMRVFGGLSVEETAAILGISGRTVKRDWTMARAWLQIRLRNRTV
jgi:RNA polymerase sigma factor (TIGR02999 family)